MTRSTSRVPGAATGLTLPTGARWLWWRRMASPSRTAEREEERRHNVRTLAAASAGSAAAALLTSQLWIAGTWIAAAFTPLMVALISELMNRPAERIKRTFTTDRPALPEAGGAAPPARPGADPLPTRAPAEPGSGGGPAEPPVRVYRAGDAEPRDVREGVRRRKIALGAVFGTAALAFLIAVTIITVPELLAGGSVGKREGGSTFFGSGDKSGGDRERDEPAPQDTTQEEQPPPEEQQTAPEEEQPTTTTEQPTEEEPLPPEETAPPGEPVPEQVPPTEQP
jgi:hypothetical protein